MSTFCGHKWEVTQLEQLGDFRIPLNARDQDEAERAEEAITLLLEAAPALLEALKEVLSVLNEMALPNRLNSPAAIRSWIDNSATALEARAAIAAALGEA